ncbi:MAG: hypothetical protein ACK5QS_17525 [Pseudanabaenaceae cyanobacterium]
MAKSNAKGNFNVPKGHYPFLVISLASSFFIWMGSGSTADKQRLQEAILEIVIIEASVYKTALKQGSTKDK